MSAQSEEEHAQNIMNERLKMAADWLNATVWNVRFPPNVEQIHIKIHYDDGRELKLELSEKDQPT